MGAQETVKAYPSKQTLVEDRAASRVYAKDATLYSFSKEAEEYSANFMGWTDLASNPPCPLADIAALASYFIDQGFKLAVLIGQGGSTQAAMTLTKYFKDEAPGMKFRVLDSDSPVRLRGILADADPRTTLVIASSKSGGTLEMNSMLAAVSEAFSVVLAPEELPLHLVAITDPSSPLAQRAQDEGWAGLLLGESAVGGRFSALSVFGLFPAALAGIDLEKLIESAAEMERACSEDTLDNPAIALAAFMYDNWLAGRDKIAFLTQKSGRVLGLWVEQLVAESTGKQGLGILPQLEIDPLLLRRDMGDRMVVSYLSRAHAWDDIKEFEMGLSCVSEDIPRLDYEIDSVYDLAKQFVMWEYATAMCGHLMRVSPFDQPDVASAKAKVLEMLENGLPEPSFVEEMVVGSNVGKVEAYLSDCCAEASDIRSALRSLLESFKPGDYFALNAFVPFTGEGRREALEAIRHDVAGSRMVTACLEIGPRYLHSTGQLQKGGPNTGVFLIVSADELKDIKIPDGKASSLGALSKAQASGDMAILSARGRRCLHLHLPDNSGVTLRCLANIVAQVLAEIERDELR
ncbi:MAG: glucose-6-phosphate isomerase [Eggerthellaceae bacterium]|nr:glucose-6-phosphate isomerase [Eggerthellaceae bacterium]